MRARIKPCQRSSSSSFLKAPFLPRTTGASTAMGAAGRAKAERLWSWPRLLDRMDAAYAEAIAERRRRTG